MRLIAAALLLAASAAAAGDPEAEVVTIEVTHLTVGKQWRAEYRLQAPAERLDFIRRYDHRRHLGWQPENPDFELVRQGEGEVLRRKDGRPFDRVSLGLRSDRAAIQRDYPLNSAFTDGSEWLYTGHFYARPVREGRAPRSATALELVFQPATGEGLVVDGHRQEPGFRWRDPDPDTDGTVVYFGSLEPLTAGGFTALIDPGLPRYLRAAFERYLPELSTLYRTRLGYEALRAPNLLITYNPQGSSRSHGGDALPAVLTFKFAGSAWAEDSAANREDAVFLIAHEMAHLWNGRRFTNDGAENAIWMHEGGADALAALALARLGAIDRARLAARIERALNECVGITGLRAPLAAEFAQRRFALAYACGAVMNQLVDRAWARRDGLFGFWHELFAVAERKGGMYSATDWIALVRRRDPELAQFLGAVWRGPTAPGPDAFAAQLRRAGFQVRTADPPPGAQLQYAAKALEGLMAEDCGGQTNFWYEPGGATIGGLPACRTLKAEQIEVRRLGGRPFGAGREAYVAVRSACSTGTTAPVGLDDGRVLELQCPSGGYPAPPDWLALGN